MRMTNQENYPKDFHEFILQFKFEDDYWKYRKLSTYRGKLFYCLIQRAVKTSPVPLNEIMKSKS